MRDAYKDIGLGLFLLAAALLMLFWIIPVGVQTPGSARNPILSPPFWPRLIMIALAGLSLIIIAQAAARIRRIKKGLADEVAVTAALDASGAVKVVIAIALLFVYYWSLTWGGLVVPSMLAILVFTALYGEKRFQYFAPAALLFPLAIYYFFTDIAQVPIPLGVFENLVP